MTLILTTLVLIVHLLCVNVASGSPLICVWLEWRGGKVELRASRSLVGISLATLFLGGVLGLVLGAFKGSGDYWQFWIGPLGYKATWGALELAFSVVLLSGCWLWAGRKSSGARWPRLARAALLVLAATNLLYHFPFLFIVANRLWMEGLPAGRASIDAATFRQLMMAQDTPALAVHVMLASVAVSGLALAIMGLRQADTRLIGWGGRWSLAATLLQLPVGLWILGTMPADLQPRVLGSDGLATVLFLVSAVVTLWLARELASLSLGETSRPVLLRAAAAMLIVVSLMTMLDQHLRRVAMAATTTQSQE